MNDLISRQEEIDAIDVLKRNYPSSCFEDLCKAVDIAIKVLSAQLEQRWIPVSERLPEDGYVLQRIDRDAKKLESNLDILEGAENGTD